jgi:ribosomal protein S4
MHPSSYGTRTVVGVFVKKRNNMSLMKKNRDFLNNVFPENLIPLKKINKKQKKLLRGKTLYIRKNIRKTENQIIKQNKISNNSNKLEYFSNLSKQNKHSSKFLFSLDQIKYKLTKKQAHHRKFSDFKNQLKERKKLSILYGNLPKKQIKNCYEKACQLQGKIHEKFLFFLETRLDIVVFRICFFKTILSARQAITQKKVLVNGKIVDIASYFVKAGDVISINRKYSKKYATEMLEYIKVAIYLRRSRSILNQFFQKKLIKPFSSKQQQMQFLKQVETIKKPNAYFSQSLQYLQNISKKSHDILFYLTIKKIMHRKRANKQKLLALRYSHMKPLNIEVSHKLCTAIFLYSPQKIVLPATIDLELVARSL